MEKMNKNVTKKCKCPKCGSENISITRNRSNNLKECICQNCGKSWLSKAQKKELIVGFLLLCGIILLAVICFW